MGKNYVVVGATSGIGQQVAARLVEPETTVYALSRRGDQGEGPPSVIHTGCDVLSDEPTFPEVDGPIDGLAYFPGTITLKPFHLLRRRDFLHDLEVNYLGAVKTLQHYLPQIKKADSASIVLMSTVAVQTGLPFHASIAGDPSVTGFSIPFVGINGLWARGRQVLESGDWSHLAASYVRSFGVELHDRTG